MEITADILRRRESISREINKRKVSIDKSLFVKSDKDKSDLKKAKADHKAFKNTNAFNQKREECLSIIAGSHNKLKWGSTKLVVK